MAAPKGMKNIVWKYRVKDDLAVKKGGVREGPLEMYKEKEIHLVEY